MKLTYVGRSIIYRRPDETVRFKSFLLQTERKVRNSRASLATALDENDHVLREPQSHIRNDLREIRELLNGMMLQSPDSCRRERDTDVLACSSRLFQLTETTAVLKRAGAEFVGLSLVEHSSFRRTPAASCEKDGLSLKAAWKV